MPINDAAWKPETVNFLDLHFTALDLDGAVDAITARASLDAPFAYVVTPNVDHMVKLDADKTRRPLYDAAWLTLNDSRVLKALAARAGMKLPTAAGSDIAERLFDLVIDRHEPVTIIGGDAEAIAELKRRYGLSNVRWHQPPRDLKSKPEAIVAAAAFVAAQPSRFTFLSVGAPQQELLGYAIAQRGDAHGIGLCVGAAIDFLSGRQQRAPRWMRALSLEWAHRLASQPQRMWRRYLVDGPRVFAMFSAWRAAMAAPSAA